MSEGLLKSTDRTVATMTDIQKRLAVIDEAQKNITELSNQVVGLQDILANKQARGAFGEMQLQDLVTAVLPPSAYAFQATLGNGARADCLLQAAQPAGADRHRRQVPAGKLQRAARRAADDAREAGGAARLRAGRDEARRATSREQYIVPGETAESALMFLPSEAVYAELHANFRDVGREVATARGCGSSRRPR